MKTIYGLYNIKRQENLTTTFQTMGDLLEWLELRDLDLNDYDIIESEVPNDQARTDDQLQETT